MESFTDDSLLIRVTFWDEVVVDAFEDATADENVQLCDISKVVVADEVCNCGVNDIESDEDDVIVVTTGTLLGEWGWNERVVVVFTNGIDVVLWLSDEDSTLDV